MDRPDTSDDYKLWPIPFTEAHFEAGEEQAVLHVSSSSVAPSTGFHRMTVYYNYAQGANASTEIPFFTLGGKTVPLK
jgi:hypothetical protein